MLADAILRHRHLTLVPALHAALQAAGEYVAMEKKPVLQAYADALAIDVVPDGFRYAHREGKPLLGLGPLELFTEPDNPHLLTRCAVWYGEDTRVEWVRRGGGNFAACAATPPTIRRHPSPAWPIFTTGGTGCRAGLLSSGSRRSVRVTVRHVKIQQRLVDD
jgi:hypothetical protein